MTLGGRGLESVDRGVCRGRLGTGTPLRTNVSPETDSPGPEERPPGKE